MTSPNPYLPVSMLMLAFVAGLTTARGEDISWQTNAQQAWDQAREEGRPLVMFITRQGCHYCEKMKSQTFTDQELCGYLEAGFVPLEVDSSQEQEVANKLGVRAYPTTVVIAVRATQPVLLDRIVGYMSADKLRQRLAVAKQRDAVARKQSR